MVAQATTPEHDSVPPKQAVITGRVYKKKIESSTLSTALTLGTNIDALIDQLALKPVDGEPPAWADTRPALCDALPWFRAVQGGVYHSLGVCWGFLLDADCGARSYMDDEVLITRIGGGCTKDAKGNLTLVRDQDSDSATLTSIVNSKEFRIPVGIVIGDRNQLLGRKVPHRYNVLAYFRITDIWFEKVGSKKGAKVRFEKLDLSVKSWWAEPGSPTPHPHARRDFSLQPEEKQCGSCKGLSRRIYNEGWMCLQPLCPQFWTMDCVEPPLNLTFHSRFLAYRHPVDLEMKPHHSLVPDLLSTFNDICGEESILRIAWKGIVCPKCSKCIPRRFWRGWKCSNDFEIHQMQPDSCCSYEKIVQIHPISLRSVIDEFELGPIKRMFIPDSKSAAPEIDDVSCSPYRKLTYSIPGVGSITHFVSNKAINSRSNGPNQLFVQMQVADLGLRRYPLQQSVVAGTLTAHFAVNFGMPYKYVVSVDSKGFSEAPDGILHALGRLSWATERVVSESGDIFLRPNEMLVLGYFEEMKIGYHDDGESSLGPTIATLSLGAKASMLIRMKHKYYHGFSKAKKLLTDDPVLPGCQFEGKRRELKAKYLRGEISQTAYDEHRHQLFKGARGGEAPACIKMELNHGDLVVMHGEKLQKYYEHAVVPDKKLRFALTTRYIKPYEVDREEWAKGDYTLSPDQIYDGK